MAKAVALIRGVGGRTAMKMAELRATLEAAGIEGIVTLQVAGNVVFDVPAGRGGVAGVGERMQAAVLERFGFDLPVLVRTHDELVDSIERHPYLGTVDGAYAYTYFLDAVSAPERRAALDPDRSPGDVFTVDGAEVFIRYGDGVATSKLQLPWFERGLGVIGTGRNANTIAKLAALSA